MKGKKVGLFLLGICILFMCSACNGTITRDIRHAGFSVGGTFTCSSFFPADKEDTNYQKIRYITDTHIINTEGVIYDLSLGQPFANNQNCKLAGTDLIVKAILDNKIIKAKDDKYYYLVGENSVTSYTQVPKTDNSYDIYHMLLKNEDIVKVVTADSSQGIYYVLKEDGNVYGYTIAKKDYKSLPQITGSQIVYNKNDYDGKIIDFNYAGNSLNTFVRTEDKVFRMRITNADECSKYADKPCDFKMQEDEMFVTYKDNIVAFNGSILITDYKQIFSVTS